jgi:transcriptional regulator with XRE-family HTH domain
VIERARGQCEHCGLHVGRSGWIHHKTSRGMTCNQYNDLNNLALVCPPCHRRARRTRREELPPRLAIVAPSKASKIRLGEQILRRRQEHHLTRKQLATRAHTSQAYLAQIERGGRLASADLLARIAQVLRCSATELAVIGADRRNHNDGCVSTAAEVRDNAARPTSSYPRPRVRGRAVAVRSRRPAPALNGHPLGT